VEKWPRVAQRGETFGALYSDRGKSLDEVIHLFARMAEQLLCRPAP
jgi:hypothetical protein